MPLLRGGGAVWPVQRSPPRPATGVFPVAVVFVIETQQKSFCFIVETFFSRMLSEMASDVRRSGIPGARFSGRIGDLLRVSATAVRSAAAGSLTANP